MAAAVSYQLSTRISQMTSNFLTQIGMNIA